MVFQNLESVPLHKCFLPVVMAMDGQAGRFMYCIFGENEKGRETKECGYSSFRFRRTGEGANEGSYLRFMRG